MDMRKTSLESHLYRFNGTESYSHMPNLWDDKIISSNSVNITKTNVQAPTVFTSLLVSKAAVQEKKSYWINDPTEIYILLNRTIEHFHYLPIWIQFIFKNYHSIAQRSSGGGVIHNFEKNEKLKWWQTDSVAYNNKNDDNLVVTNIHGCRNGRTTFTGSITAFEVIAVT